MKNDVKYVIHSMLLINFLFFSMLLLACGGSSNNNVYWFIDPPEIFHTNDIQRAQKEIPFNIVLPTYLSSNTGYLPDITGPLKGTCPENNVGIDIIYQARGKDYYAIWIKEDIGVGIIYPPSDVKVNYTNIDGVQVMDWESHLTSISSSGAETHKSHKFVWKQNDIYFDIVANCYDRDEAIKIVESMIVQ